ncbi:MAG TPA: hypothetical protein VM578_11740 [Candidatus Saccharimonadales bacterium]|nr:hypothetical protein [Candidatus Saccharimonadales bacterium]
MRKLSFFLLIIAVATLLPTLATGWGDVGHTTINHAAAERVPANMPQFLKAASDHIAWDGPEPDRWRSNLEQPLNNSQAPDHFIDLEYVDWLKPLPPDRYKFIQAVYEYRAQHPQADMPQPEKIGLQPYITIEVFDRLKVAFREYRHAQATGHPTANAEANAVFYAAWLGHYVGDGSNPMHTSIQYNGWVGPNPNGYTTAHDVHSRMETSFVNANPEVTHILDLVGTPKYLDHPFDDYIAYLQESHSKVEQAYQLEKACGFDGKGTPESREFIRQQLGRGSQMLLNMWYTAWVDSAKDPEPWHGERHEPRICNAPKESKAAAAAAK